MYMSKDCQGKYLSRLVENQSVVSVYLRNGVKLTGKIIAATDDMIFLNSPAPQVIYKSRVVSVMPEARVN